jgi:hypothetical protein
MATTWDNVFTGLYTTRVSSEKLGVQSQTGNTLGVEMGAETFFLQNLHSSVNHPTPWAITIIDQRHSQHATI